MLSARLELIRHRQSRYAALFAETNWCEDELSNIGWLGLVAVPWLLAQLDGDGNHQSDNRNCNSNPGSDCVGLPDSSLEFVLSEQPIADAPLVVKSGYPFAKFFVCLFAKAVGVEIVWHESSNVK